MTPISDLTAFKRCLFGIAGHATVARQRDHVFRPQSCWLLQYYSITIFVWLLHINTETLTFFDIFLVLEALSHCPVVVVIKLKNCRAPSSVFWILILPAKKRKSSTLASVSPRHCRLPMEKGIRWSSLRTRPAASKNRSGRNRCPSTQWSP